MNEVSLFRLHLLRATYLLMIVGLGATIWPLLLGTPEAAEHFRELGYREVYNVEGGIDAWAEAVDPAIPRY